VHAFCVSEEALMFSGIVAHSSNVRLANSKAPLERRYTITAYKASAQANFHKYLPKLPNPQ
jgi:hypothetical protein